MVVFVVLESIEQISLYLLVSPLNREAQVLVRRELHARRTRHASLSYKPPPIGTFDIKRVNKRLENALISLGLEPLSAQHIVGCCQGTRAHVVLVRSALSSTVIRQGCLHCAHTNPLWNKRNGLIMFVVMLFIVPQMLLITPLLQGVSQETLRQSILKHETGRTPERGRTRPLCHAHILHQIHALGAPHNRLLSLSVAAHLGTEGVTLGEVLIFASLLQRVLPQSQASVHVGVFLVLLWEEAPLRSLRALGDGFELR
mmetsp:Transcript_36025/g.70885  ORF Transcript_36025/g.70885 Transcript_36025/m.70885 type:complete len:257 (+) Transcript_36025:1642-2412(+)